MEAGFGLGGNQPVSGLLWGRIAAVDKDHDAVSVAVDGAQGNVFLGGLFRGCNGIVQEVSEDGHQVDVFQLGEVAGLDIILKGNAPHFTVDFVLIQHNIQKLVAAAAAFGVVVQLFGQLCNIVSDCRVFVQGLDGGQVFLGVVGIEHQLLVLPVQDLIIGLLRLQSAQFALDLQGLALLPYLVGIRKEQENSRNEKAGAGDGQKELHIAAGGGPGTDVPKNCQAYGYRYRIHQKIQRNSAAVISGTQRSDQEQGDQKIQCFNGNGLKNKEEKIVVISKKTFPNHECADYDDRHFDSEVHGYENCGIKHTFGEGRVKTRIRKDDIDQPGRKRIDRPVIPQQNIYGRAQSEEPGADQKRFGGTAFLFHQGRIKNIGNKHFYKVDT